MKVLIITNKMPYPPKDGGSIATLSLAMSLYKSGVEVDLLSMNTSKHYFDCKDIPTEIANKLNISSVDVCTEINLLKALKNFLFSSIPYNAERFISEDFKVKITELLTANKYDIVQLEGLYLSPYIGIIRKYSNAKIAYRSHNIEHEIWLRASENEKNFLKKYYKRNLAKRIKKFELTYLNDYDLLIPITKRDAEFYSSLGNTKPVHVTSTGIDADNLLFDLDDSKAKFPGFFHIGALDWIPNQEGLCWFLQNVWSKFIKNHKDAKFYVAGRNASEEYVRFLKNNNVVYLGEVENSADFISQGSVFIVPLLSGSGMRIKIIEGMAAAKTIITTSIGTEGINTENGKNILVADNPVDFYSQMEKIYNDIELHKKISANARLFVRENFDNLRIAIGLSTFYYNNLK